MDPAPLALIEQDGTLRPGASDPALADDRLASIYRSMRLIRVLDERMLAMQRQGRIGFVGTATGLEAAIIGSGAAFEPQDWIFPALREGGLAVHRGMPLLEYVGQMIGNAVDTAKGRQMCNHFQHAGGHFVSWSSVIGTQLPQAVGAAYAAKLRGEPAVMAAYLGDGAASSNGFHSAATFAGVWKVPVVFVMIDNGWAISVPAERQSAARSQVDRGPAYGLRAVSVDGNDALACYTATRDLVERARRGEGPGFLHLKTYRMHGHSSSDDPTKYRDEAEVRRWAALDPVERLKNYLLRRALWDEARDQELVASLDAEVREAVRVVEAAPPLELRTLVEDIYAEVPLHLRKQYNVYLDAARKHGDATPSDVPFPL